MVRVMNFMGSLIEMSGCHAIVKVSARDVRTEVRAP